MHYCLTYRETEFKENFVAMKCLFCFILILIIHPATVFALGLGDLDLNSALNEPFEARVELLSPTADELDSMKIALADTDAFARSGLERPFLLSKLKFDLKRSIDDGPDYIRIYSREPIREPFLNFLIEVNWGKARLLREYTVLLDPPLYDPNAKRAINVDDGGPLDPPLYDPNGKRAINMDDGGPPLDPSLYDSSAKRASKIAPGESLELTETITDSSAAVIDEDHQVVYADDFEKYQTGIPVTTSAASQIDYAGGDYGPTSASDTLWSIASAMRSGNTSVNQMMLALFNANPDAFFNQNINALKRGQILRMPSDAEINALTQSQALEEVKVQYAAWETIKGIISSSVSERPETIVTQTELSEAAVSTEIEEDAAELKLVGAGAESTVTEQSDGSDADSAQALILAQESIQALTQENIELKDQLQESEVLLNDLKRLLSLKDNELAALQAQMGQQMDEESEAAINEVMTEPGAEIEEMPAAVEEVTDEAIEVVGDEAAVATEEVADIDTTTDQVLSEDSVVTEPGVVEEVIEPEVEVVEEVATVEEPTAPVEGVTVDEEPVEEETEQPYLDMPESILAPLTGLLGRNPLFALAAVALIIVLVLLFIVMKFRKKSGISAVAESTGTVEAFDVEEDDIDPEAITADPESESEAEISVADIDETEDDDEEKKARFVAAEPDVESAKEELDEDPLQEVNIYLAFEQFDQAEEFVRNAITDTPDNLEFHTKLLEVFYTSGNKKSYEEEAKVLHELVSGQGEHWDMAVVMWSEMSPGRALFEEGADDGDDSEDTTGGGFVDVTADAEAPEEDAGLDFDIGAGAKDAAATDSDEELLDITAAADSEDILDVTAAVGMDISDSTAADDLLNVTAVDSEDSVLDISADSGDSEELLDIPASQESALKEDLLDATAEVDIELDSDDDLLGVTAVTGADVDQLLDLDINSLDETGAVDAEASVETEDSNVINFDLVLSTDEDKPAADADSSAFEEMLDTEAETIDSAMSLDTGVATDESESIESDFELDAGDNVDEEPAQSDVAEDSADDLSFDLDIGSHESTEESSATDEDMSEMEFDITINESDDSDDDLELDTTVEIPKLDINDEDQTVFVPRAAQPDEKSAQDEIATKLDLAKAYVELGDKDSAKTILNEVMQEGNDEQKKQAQDLLNQT